MCFLCRLISQRGLQFSGVQQEIEFQISVSILNSIQNTKKKAPREGLF